MTQPPIDELIRAEMARMREMEREMFGMPRKKPRQSPEDDIDAMLPRDLLKYSEKVAPEQIEKRVAEIVKKCTAKPTDGLTPVGTLQPAVRQALQQAQQQGFFS
jgi:hypothetical protein